MTAAVVRHLSRACIAAAMVLSAATAQNVPGKRDAGGYPAPTARLERGRTVYVLSSCHFCHGIDLTGAAMGAADLLHLPLVGRDEGGNLIGPIVRAGLPNLQTAMPQYSDYTPQQISDLAAYIHYLRQQGRYRELSGLKDIGAGDGAAGQEYFKGTSGKCTTCHSPSGDLAGIGRKYDAATLLGHMLHPGPADVVSDDGASPGVAAHRKLLERYSDADVRNLLAYLEDLR